MSEQITKEDETNKLLTQLLTKHAETFEKQEESLEKQDKVIAENSEAINLLKEQNTEILESIKKTNESIDSLTKQVSDNTSANPVGTSPGIPGEKGNAGKKEDAPNALAPDEKDSASGADSAGSDKEGLSGETKKTYKSEDKTDNKEVEKDHDEKDKEEKMKKDEQVDSEKDKKKEDEKKMEKGKSLPGSYRSSIDKADADNPKVFSSILKSMTGEGFKEKTVTPQMVKSRVQADIIKQLISSKDQGQILKALPVGGSS